MEIAILIVLILVNGVFAMSEVALLTARRPRLSAMANNGDALAAAAVKIAADPTHFLSTVQIGITAIGLLNGIFSEALLAPPLARWMQSLGLEQKLSAILATVLVVVAVTYVSIVVGELVPKRLGQINAEGVARLVAWPMRVLAVVTAPFVRLLTVSTNTILTPLLRLLRVKHVEGAGEPLTPEEIRTLVLESSRFMPKKHVSMLLNLFDIQEITVQDVMVPRARIEAIRLDEDIESISRQLATAYHREIPVYRGSGDEIAGVLRTRKVLGLLASGTLDKAALEALLDEPYYVPASTPVIAQLQYFQENRERIALVVDEYGELMGLAALEDIIEEIIGKFTTSLPTALQALAWDADGVAAADGSMPVREVNRALGLELPTGGPKTLNGLILEHLQDIPEAEVSMKIAGVPMEIVHAQGRSVKTVRLFRPRSEAPAEPAGES